MAGMLTCSTDIVKNMTPDEVWDIVKGDRKEEYLLVDVRTPSEYKEKHIPGAKLIPLNELDKRSSELDRQKKIVTYCRSGMRSMGGAILLCNQGFRELYNMIGGITNWSHETVGGPEEEAEHFFKEIKEIKELLLFALQTETSSQTFYHQAAEKLAEKEVVDLLNKLYQAEGKHKKIIYVKLKELWLEAPPLEKITESEFMEGTISLPQALLAIELEQPKSRMDILELALEKECKAYDLYQRMADKVEPTLGEIFRVLAGQERRHIDELSQLL